MTSAVTDQQMRRISNSEVSTWLLCKRKYYYQFDLNLVPIRMAPALSRGIIGHEVLQKYYECLKDGKSFADSVTEARRVLMGYMQSSFDMELVLELDKILQGYWNHYATTDLAQYEILEVENNYDLPLVDNFSYTLRFDLYLKERATGKYVLMDHKFIYDFWTQDKINLSPQFPKYTGALRSNDRRVDKCVLNQIRYRKIKEPTPDQLFKRTDVVPSNAKVRNALKEQIIASQDIVQHRSLPPEVRGEHALGVRNPLVCNYCDMAQLCQSEFDGGDIKYLIETEYKQSEYGYNKTTQEAI